MMVSFPLSFSLAVWLCKLFGELCCCGAVECRSPWCWAAERNVRVSRNIASRLAVRAEGFNMAKAL